MEDCPENHAENTFGNLPILMTASVSTRGMVGADFSDEAREAMYVETLLFYCREILAKEPERHIVFVENSGWDVNRLKQRMPGEFCGRIEFIALAPEDFDISKGKGYNELILINQAIEKSAAIRRCGAFLKVTGRYPIFNLDYFLRKAGRFIAAGGKFYGDIKDHGLYDFIFGTILRRPERAWNGHAAYTVLFASRVDFYRETLGSLYSQCNDYIDRFIENVWFDELAKYRGAKNCGVSLRFGREPVCGGLQGSNDNAVSFSKDNNSLKSRVMRLVGNTIRTLFPWFWF